jgi:hypothetical protein
VTAAYGDERLPARFWEKVQPEPNTGCWLWTGAAINTGYGKVNHGRPSRQLLAHRVAFTELVGEIPPGRQMDHLCRVRLCCNPAHLEAVTAAQNVWRRAVAPKPAERRVLAFGPESKRSHGNRSSYARGCRCEPCTAANTRACGLYHAHRDAKEAPDAQPRLVTPCSPYPTSPPRPR